MENQQQNSLLSLGTNLRRALEHYHDAVGGAIESPSNQSVIRYELVNDTLTQKGSTVEGYIDLIPNKDVDVNDFEVTVDPKDFISYYIKVTDRKGNEYDWTWSKDKNIPYLTLWTYLPLNSSIRATNESLSLFLGVKALEARVALQWGGSVFSHLVTKTMGSPYECYIDTTPNDGDATPTKMWATTLGYSPDVGSVFGVNPKVL